MKKSILVLGISVIFVACGTSKKSATETVTKLTPKDVTEFAETITSAELKEHLYIYASDEFEGRETGEPGQKKAVEYLKNEYANLKLKSPTTNGSYIQNVPLNATGSPDLKLSVNEKSLTNFNDVVSLSAAPNGEINASDVVFAGYGIEDKNYSDYTNLNVKGKIVIVKNGEPKNEDGTHIVSGTAEASKWSKPRQSAFAKRDVAKEKGAKALFYIDEPLFNRYSSLLKRRAESGGSSLSLIENNDDAMYFFLAGNNFSDAFDGKLDKLINSKILNTNISFSFKNNAKEISSENVIAYIKGSEKPDEYIVISSHLDHIGKNSEGEINNGADDDGSGTVALLEIAEAFKSAADNGQGPKRSVIFLHVTGEEKGLLGSRYYTDIDPIVPLKQTVANLNIDMIGRIDPKREGDRNYIYLIGSDKLSTELHNLSEEVNKKYTNIELDYTYNDENDPNRFYYRSDHYNFAKNNVPIIFYFNGTHDDYHRPSDTPDKIEYDLLENRTRLVFYTAWEVANKATRIIADKAEKKN